jgi:hypothetical protein
MVDSCDLPIMRSHTENTHRSAADEVAVMGFLESNTVLENRKLSHLGMKSCC